MVPNSTIFLKYNSVESFHNFYVPVPECGCWLWDHNIGTKGYGLFAVRLPKGKSMTYGAHRVSWEIHNGAIPKGLQVLHKCDVRNCVNPAHLFLGTHDENMKDMTNKKRHRTGAKSPVASFTARDIYEIKSALPYMQQQELADIYGVHKITIGRIARNQTYINEFDGPRQSPHRRSKKTSLVKHMTKVQEGV